MLVKRLICSKLLIGMMPGDDRQRDAARAGAVDELEVVVVVEEELRDQEARAGADLVLQVREVGLASPGASGCVSG